MTNDTYPPLPDYDECLQGKEISGGVYERGFRADQMHAYLAADRAERGEVVAWMYVARAGDMNPMLSRVRLTNEWATGDAWIERPLYSAPPSHAGDEALLRQCLEALDYAADVINNGCRSTDAAMEAVSGANLAIAALRERLAKEG